MLLKRLDKLKVKVIMSYSYLVVSNIKTMSYSYYKYYNSVKIDEIRAAELARIKVQKIDA
jgi:hypothetical protein